MDSYANDTVSIVQKKLLLICGTTEQTKMSQVTSPEIDGEVQTALPGLQGWVAAHTLARTKPTCQTLNPHNLGIPRPVQVLPHWSMRLRPTLGRRCSTRTAVHVLLRNLETLRDGIGGCGKYGRQNTYERQDLERRFTQVAHHFQTGRPANKIIYLRPYLKQVMRLKIELKASQTFIPIYDTLILRFPWVSSEL